MPEDRPSKIYIAPYSKVLSNLSESLDQAGQYKLTVTQLNDCLKLLLRAVQFDESWYLHEYPDVKAAVARGEFRSGKHHFAESGYFEGRRLASITVDEEWYSRAYPDVGQSLEFGELTSCQEHFEQFGEEEGRIPFEDC
jgi:hypothetical protein